MEASSDVAWSGASRIIRTVYPPVDLFEDIADPADWELLASAEAKTNPRVRDQVGDLALVPKDRRVGGPTASIVMAAFTHASRDRPSRFTDGGYGAWYCGDRFEVALAETAWHFERFMAATDEPQGEADFRELSASIFGRLVDLREAPGGPDTPHPVATRDACLDALDYAPGQALGRTVHRAGLDGIVYPSVRLAGGQAACLFRPDRVRLPVLQAKQLRYHWNGRRMDRWFVHGEEAWIPRPG